MAFHLTNLEKQEESKRPGKLYKIKLNSVPWRLQGVQGTEINPLHPFQLTVNLLKSAPPEGPHSNRFINTEALFHFDKPQIHMTITIIIHQRRPPTVR